jgi:polyhydroxybutyrate depolymerase
MTPIRAALAAVALTALAAGCAGDSTTSGTTTAPTSGASTTAAGGVGDTASSTTAPPPAAPACGEPSELEPGANVRTLQSSGGERTYILWVPDGYTGDEPAPVVFTFHGRGSNKEQQLAYSAFGPRAQEEGALVVAPDAIGDPMQWSPGGAMTDANDLEFVDDLIADVAAVACVDSDRFLATGMSSGGFMTSMLACERSDTFAAYGPVTFTLYQPPICDDAPPLPIISFHGTDDGVVPFEGVGGRGIPEVMADWAAHNGCDPEPTEERIGTEVLHRAWTGCDAVTELYIVEGGGHTWPGAIDVAPLGYTTHDISATEILWELFVGD